MAIHLIKEESQISFTKWKEHLLCRTRHLPAFMLTFVLLALCLVSVLGIITEATQIVTVSDSDGQSETFIGVEDDIETLIAQSGITAQEGDIITHVSYYGGTRRSINIQRAFDVTVTADGLHNKVALVEGTVEDALREVGVTLGEYDYTTPSLNEPLQEGDIILVHRVEYRQSVEYEVIPFETEYVYTSLYFRNTGKQTVLQEGSEGQTDITSTERWVDGVLESSQISSIVVSKEPVNSIVKAYAKGAPVSALTGPDGTTDPPSSYSAVYTGRSTGYSASRGSGSSGLGLGYGTVAVNPNLIPYGSLLYIVSTDGKLVYGYAIATDTGAALIEGNALVDCFYETYEESALHWAQNMNVYVVDF